MPVGWQQGQVGVGAGSEELGMACIEEGHLGQKGLSSPTIRAHFSITQLPPSSPSLKVKRLKVLLNWDLISFLPIHFH